MINTGLLKKVVIGLVNCVLGIFIVKWLWLHVDMHLLIDESMKLNQTSIILSMLLGISLYFFYGFRMAVLLDISLYTSTQIVIMGFGFNALLPFRLGEVLKVIITKQFFTIDLTKTSFATMIEKGLDLAVIGCFTLMVFPGGVNYITPLLVLFIAAVAILLRTKSHTKVKNQYLARIIMIIQPMLRKNKYKPILVSTLAIWGVTCIIFYLFFKINMHQNIPFSFLDAIALLVFTTLSLTIPSMPASIGLFESGIVYYLTSRFHFLNEKAVAYAIIFHLIMVIPQVLFTLITVLVNTLGFEKLGVISNDV